MGTTATKQIPRDPGPYKPGRRCDACSCFLTTMNPGPKCAPCNRGEWNADSAEVITRIASITDLRQRQRAFEAYAEMQERKVAA